MAYVGLAMPVIKPVTGTGFKFGKAIAVDIEPQYAEAALYGDNDQAEYEKRFKFAKITLGTSTIPVAAHTAMFGHTVNTETDTTTFKTTDKSSYVGFGIYTEEVVDGVTKYTALWCPKTKFSDPKDGYETKGENIAYKTPSIEGQATGDDTKVWKEVVTFDTEAEAQDYLETKAGIV